MKHYTSSRFWQCFDCLPPGTQNVARKNYLLLRTNPTHPSLQFKPVNNGRYRSVRIGLHYRALGMPVANGVLWFWIGRHADYDNLLA